MFRPCQQSKTVALAVCYCCRVVLFLVEVVDPVADRLTFVPDLAAELDGGRAGFFVAPVLHGANLDAKDVCDFLSGQQGLREEVLHPLAP